MAVHRRPIGQYLFPIGSLGLAALIHFGATSIEHSPLSIKILALIVVAIFMRAMR